MSTQINVSKKITVKDEAVVLTSDVNSINFTGTGITATTVGNNVTVTVPGSTPGVTSVTGTSPVVSSGGLTPAISMGVASGLNNGYLANSDWTSFNNKQSSLISGSNIKTINSTTILGAGDLPVQATLVSGTNIKTVNGTSILGSGNIVAGGNRVTQASATSFNQYQAAAGPAMTMVFNAMVISTALPVPDSFLGQIIDVDFLARNTSGSSTLLRVYVSSTPNLLGAQQVGNYTTNGIIDSMIRFQHRYVVSRLTPIAWALIGVDSLGISNDFVGPGTLLSPGAFNYTSLGSPVSFGGFSPYIIVALNQGGSLIAASINY
jgi:hypothetical protein